MDGFKRPNRSKPPQRAQRPVVEPQPRPTEPLELPPIDPPVDTSTERALAQKKRRLSKKAWIIFSAGMFAMVCMVAMGAYALSPKQASASESVPVEIVSGMLPGQIADKLEASGVIRSSFVFSLYARLTRAQNSLQAGNYQISPADSTPKIVAQLQKGPAVNEIEVTFTPGATLADSRDVLLKLGYSSNEIDAAFSARYDHPLLRDLPANSDLEGYIFGETHRFVKGTPVKDILERYFDDYYAVIEENNLLSGYKKQKLRAGLFWASCHADRADEGIARSNIHRYSGSFRGVKQNYEASYLHFGGT